MDKVEETRFLEITQVFGSSAVTDEKKLVLTEEDLNTIFSLLDQLNESQQLLSNVLVRIFTMCVYYRSKGTVLKPRVLVELQNWSR